MCCFDHPYSGVFEDYINRRVSFIGVAAIEIAACLYLSIVGMISFLSIMTDYMRSHAWIAGIFLIIFLLFGLMHCLLFRGPRALAAQVLLVLIANTSLVIFIVMILSLIGGEYWNPAGVVSSCFVYIGCIKFFGMMFTCCDAVDMTSDWGYLVEFVFGVQLILGAVLVHVFLPTVEHSLSTLIGAAIAVPLSMLALMDLHQNMSINAWWWEDKLMEGCMYQVIRRFMLTCCVRTEEPPTTLVIMEDPVVDDEEEEEVQDVEIVRVVRKEG